MVMSQAGAAQAADLGPLAWVLDETRRSIETASKKTLSFARDAKESLGVDMSSVDASQLRLARQQLHQAVGALDMVGQPVAAQMVRGMEAVVQQFVQHPEKCTDEAAGVLEKAGFALMEYLEGNLGGKPRPALGLFPQYAQIQTMAGADRVHPADLWDFQWYWANPDTPPAAQSNTYSAEVRTRLDHCVLNIMRRGDPNAATEMGVMCLGLAEGESEQRPSIFWKLASAFMQALGVQAARVDIYTKRATSRILLQYASLAAGDKKVSERLAQDLLFFCAQADVQGKDAPVLAAVRKAWGLEGVHLIAYDKPTFGLYDPAILAQARRRIEAVKENWSGLAGGDTSRLKACVDQFGLVVDSLTNLHQNSKPLAEALSRVSAHVEQTGQPPSQDLAMETATAVLFLEASFADFQPSDTVFTQRLNQLAGRLDAVRSGGQPPALESWMEELYRSVSDRETLSTVVGELRTTLGEAEQLLDQFFRAPEDKAPLEQSAKLLGQMRGVLMVLGLEDAARAVGDMGEAIAEWQRVEGDPSQADGGKSFERFANSLGALGLLVDTLAYQPEHAAERFFYDEDVGELRRVEAPPSQLAPLSELEEEHPAQEEGPITEPGALAELLEQPREAISEHLEEIAGRAALEEKPALARAASKAAEAARKDDAASLTEALDKLQSVAAPAAAPAPEPAPVQEEEPMDEGIDDELLDIFLEEAREVVQTGGDALKALAGAPGDMEQQTTLRRAFHTLKGSSRMVGLTEFGEAAWAMEQVMNAWLAENKPVSDDLRGLTGDALEAFGKWVEDISAHKARHWNSAPFRTAADALRVDGKRVPLEIGAAPAPAPEPAPVPEPAPAPEAAASTPEVAAAPEPEAVPEAEPEPAPAPDVVPEVPAPVAAAVPEEEKAEAPEPAELQLEDIFADIGDVEATEAVEVAEALEAVEAKEVPAAPEALEVQAQGAEADVFDGLDLPSLDLPEDGTGFTFSRAPEPELDLELESEPVSEQPQDDSTQVGDLVVSTPLYNIYVEEATQHAQQLAEHLARWSGDVSRPVPEDAIINAHSLAGNSATVGFIALSEMARSVEHALQRLREQPHGDDTQAKALCEAASEIRSSVEAFAEGELKVPSVVVQARVSAIEPNPSPSAQAPLTETPVEEAEAPVDAVAPVPAVAPAAPVGGQGTFAGIQEVDDFNPDMFEIFAEEAEDLFPRLDEAMRAWQGNPDSLETSKEVRRVLHTLKGSARMAGLLRLGEMAHRVESAIETVGTENVSVDAVESVQSDIDELQDAFRLLQAGGVPAAAVEVVEAVPEPVAPPPAPEPVAQPPAPPVVEPVAPPAPPAAEPVAPPVPPAPVEAPAPAAPVGGQGTFAGIQEVDDFNPDMFEIFAEEAEDLFPRLDEAMRAWQGNPDSLETSKEVRRVLHTLKGSARMAGLLRLGEMAHRVESAIETVGTEGVKVEAVEAVQRDVDELQDAFRRIQDGGAAPAPAPVPEPAPAPAPAAPVAAPVQDAPAAPAPVAPEPAPEPEPEPEPVPVVPPVQAAPEPEPAPVVPPVQAAPEPEPVPVAPAPAAPEPVQAPEPVRVKIAPAPVAVTAAAAAATSLASQTADIANLRDRVDPDLFPIVVEEAQELFPLMDSALGAWKADPGATEPREQVLRALHTLKGSARMAGAMRFGEMAHRAETSIAEVASAGGISAADVDSIKANVDDLQALLNEMLGKPAEAPKKAEPAPEPAPAAPAPEAAAPQAAAAEATAPQPAAAARTGDIAPPAPLSMVQARAVASQVVRVRSQLLDRMLTQAGEVLTTRARLDIGVGQLRTSLDDLTGNLDRLRQQLRDVEMQAESQLQSRQALSRDEQRNFDPLEFDRFTRLQELTRMMAESVNDVATVQRSLQRSVEVCENDLAAQARQSRELQHDLLRTRMVEFESISERLYRVVRQAAREVGKKVRLDITGGNIEVDRGILERMTGAFEHLLRNSVTHGIEAEDVRAARNKDVTGLVSIDVQQAGNDVSVTFHDDGAGLDLTRIREKAIQKGLITPEQQLSDDEISRLVFASGLSTAAKVSELAGRGVGMDVVRAEVQALGGRIEISTKPGEGTSFRLLLPLTMAVTHVVMLRSGDVRIGVPANVVEIVRRVSDTQLQEAYRARTYNYAGEDIPFYWSGALLQSSTRSAEPPSRSTPVVIFRSAAQRVAVHVDEVLGNQEVVVKALGPQLSTLPGLVAITTLASGDVALIYNPVALASVYGEEAQRVTQLAGEQPQEAAPAAPTQAAIAAPDLEPLVLVVDDSITVRRVTQRMLQREGFRVAMAADGLQGLERLQEERPAVVLSDIEMPRMDGFDFVRNIRADASMADLPVIMITSRIAEKHREHAKELGVNHYLGKPYSEEALLELIRSYTEKTAVPA